MKREIIFSIVIMLAGCSGIIDDGTTNPTVTPTAVNSTSQSPTLTVTTTPTDTPTPTTVSPHDWSRDRKYSYFAERFNATIYSNEVNIFEITSRPGNESISVEYTMKNPKNKTRLQREQEHLIFNYAAMVNVMTNESSEFDEEWIPKHLEITGYAPLSGERYYTAYTNYTMAKKYAESNISSTEYVLAFWDTSDFGPAADV